MHSWSEFLSYGTYYIIVPCAGGEKVILWGGFCGVLKQPNEILFQLKSKLQQTGIKS